jgi:hypothetical protein
VGIIFAFFNTLQPFNLALQWFYVLFVYLYAKSTILNARARNPNIFFSALLSRLLSRHFYPRVAIVPTIRTILSLTRLVVVDTYHSTACNSFCIGGASPASMWRPSGGVKCSGRWHGAVIEQQTRRKWSFAIRDREP